MEFFSPLLDYLWKLVIKGGVKMLEELNEIMESIIVDIASEGMGTTLGLILMWSGFFGGTYTLLNGLMTLLSSAV